MLDSVTGLLAGSAVIAVLLGAIATRITHSELMQSRRDAGRDRAKARPGPPRPRHLRTAEHAEHAGVLSARLTDRETALHSLEEALVAAGAARPGGRRRNAEARRAEVAEREGVERPAASTGPTGALPRRSSGSSRPSESALLRAEAIAWQGVASQEEVRRHA